MRKFSKWLCLLMVVALMTPSMAMAAGLTGGSGVYGVYRGKDDALYQTWYTDPLVTGGANYVVGVHDGNAYYQTANADGATSALYRVAVNLLPDTIKASAEQSEEQVKAGTTGEPELLASSVSGHALLDEVSGYVYYVDGTDTKSVHVLAWYPTLGKVDVVACTSEEPVLALSMSVNGPVLTCQSGRFLYVQLLGRSVALPADEEPVAESVMASGVEIILTESGKLSLRLDAVNNLTLPIAEDVSAFAAHDGAVYYLRRTRWMTEIARFDLTSRNNEVICRMLRELMPQLVAAGEYLYVIDTEYTVYRMSPSSGKYATYMLLKEPYADVPEYEPLLASAGEELVVYDRLKEGGTVENARYYYNVYVGSTDRTSPAPTPGAPDAPTTSPTATTAAVYKDLKRRDRNTDVKNLQEKLIELGYLDDTADGIFGEKTQVAIEQLQSDLDMTVTGVATAELQRMLFAGEISAYNPYLPLKRGDRGTRVSRMQAELKALGYYAGATDGVYGQGTEKAVTAFQKQEGLNETGQADEETLKALFSESASQNLSYIDLQSGDSGKRVAELISRLVELYYLPSTAEGNEYTSQVARGVRHFQQQNGFTANSIASEAMQEALFADDAPEYDGYVTLVPGDRNQRVRELQARLIRLGYQTGYTDGVYGSKTKSAVAAFQKRAGIKATGTADEATQRALFKSNAPTAATPTLSPTATPDPFWDLGSGVTVKVTADGTKVFESPSTDSTLLGTAKKDTQLTLLATNSTWGRVRNKFGEIGYILLKNLVYVDPTPTPTVTATPAPTDTPAPT
ncbi:MAG: peptidoglycan-binding protein, partial [Clostridia bacterium]|nr:peptidoglycan-binding protein [Clostridia bacterium]